MERYIISQNPCSTGIFGGGGISRRKGFTLSETLITIVILGIMATMFIPSIVQSYKRKQVEFNLERAYILLKTF